jgi:hypothetical protein
MEIKEFAFKSKETGRPLAIKEAIDRAILEQVIRDAANPMRRRIREERRGFIEWILRTLRRLSPKRWF